MAYDKPNYTQTPNAFFDAHLPDIKSLAELKVTLLVLRNTLGWHEKEVEMTLSELMKAGNLSRPSVIEGTSLAMERGTIRRRPSGRSFAYEPNILSVKKVYRSDDEIGKESLPTSVKKVYRSDDESLVSERNIKKETKGSKKVLDLPRRELDPKAESLRVVHDDLMKFLKAKIGDIPKPSVESKALTWLLERHNPDEVEACWHYLLSQKWRTATITWQTVKNEIGGWKLRGSPAIDTNGNGHNGNGKPAADDYRGPGRSKETPEQKDARIACTKCNGTGTDLNNGRPKLCPHPGFNTK